MTGWCVFLEKSERLHIVHVFFSKKQYCGWLDSCVQPKPQEFLSRIYGNEKWNCKNKTEKEKKANSILL